MQQTVEILGGRSGNKGQHLGLVFDATTGTYFAPELSTSVADVMKNAYRRLGVDGFTGAETKTAVIDSGMLQQHPWIKPRLIASKDFTGEGSEDLNGHGTWVTLLLLLSAPKTDIINVKVVGADGLGEERSFVDGIDWAISQGCDVINISAGTYRTKWGLWQCDGTCQVCRAAVRAARSGILVVVAAGNVPGMTACPASAGVHGRAPIVAAATWDLDRDAPAAYSGRGNFFGPAVDGKVAMRPIR